MYSYDSGCRSSARSSSPVCPRTDRSTPSTCSSPWTWRPWVRWLGTSWSGSGRRWSCRERLRRGRSRGGWRCWEPDKSCRRFPGVRLATTSTDSTLNSSNNNHNNNNSSQLLLLSSVQLIRDLTLIPGEDNPSNNNNSSDNNSLDNNSLDNNSSCHSPASRLSFNNNNNNLSQLSRIWDTSPRPRLRSRRRWDCRTVSPTPHPATRRGTAHCSSVTENNGSKLFVIIILYLVSSNDPRLIHFLTLSTNINSVVNFKILKWSINQSCLFLFPRQ